LLDHVRLVWVDQNYIRNETIMAVNAILVSAQNQIPLAKKWGGGDIASADGMRFVVPVRTGLWGVMEQPTHLSH
jgi:TnpA family transposase